MNTKHNPLGLARLLPLTVTILAAMSLLLSLNRATGQLGPLANPHWNITLSDFGYSDFLLDNTPGFEGREYLSGEWGAAVAYTVGGVQVATRWLEPQFWYPDWVTDSDFHVDVPLAQTGVNADGLPIAESVISNPHITITLRHEMLDTIVGTPMGAIPASAGGAGAFLNSDRYVLKQTCTIKNISGSPISALQLFQFLHGLSSQRGLYDNRFYAAPFSEFQYDVTLAGVDPSTAGTASADGLEDFIGFHAATAPTAFEIGYYGIEGNAKDDHVTGKPSDGVHWSVEDNWQHAPFASREGTDSFNPLTRWVSGAQRWELGTLAEGQSVSFDVILSLVTGTKVSTGTTSGGSCNGGSNVAGGLDYTFDDVISEGSCFAEYSRADENELATRVTAGEFGTLNFPTPGGLVQLWGVKFSGTYSGTVQLSLAYDPSVLPAGFDETQLAVHQSVGVGWTQLPTTVDTVGHKVTVNADVLSTFVLGVDGGAATLDVSANPNPSSSGTVTGDGTYANGSLVTLVATPYPGYAFVNWTDGDTEVSKSPTYSFIVSLKVTLQANFEPAGTGYTVTTSSQPTAGGTTIGDGAYPATTLVTVAATPNPGYRFSKWLENGVQVSASASYSFNIASDHVLVAKFKPVYTITVTIDPTDGGAVKANDDHYEDGDLAVLTATSASGYMFDSWTQSGTVVSTDPIYRFNVTGNRELVAHFTAGNRITTLEDPPNSGTTKVSLTGTEATVDATAAPGYLFVNWTEDGGEVSTEASYTFTVTASRIIVANFIPGYNITTSTAPTAGGATGGDGLYQAGASVTVTATANAGYSFKNWTEGGGEVSTEASYTFTANSSRDLVANFSTLYTITTTAAPPEGGTSSGAGIYPAGASVTVVATPSLNYRFVNWTVGGVEVSTSASYPFTAGGNRSLVANFTPITYLIMTSASPDAGGAVSGGGTYNSGDSVTVVATPNSGYTFLNWTEGEVVVTGASASYTFNATSDRILVAKFGIPQLEISAVTVTKPSSKVAAAITIHNAGTASALAVTIAAKKDATLDGKSTTDRTPISFGDIAPGEISTWTLTFSGVKTGTKTLSIKLTYTGRTVTLPTTSVPVP